MMSPLAIQQMMRAEMTAAEGRASAFARAAKACLDAGDDSSEAERALFRELDSLTLLRAKQQALHLIEQGVHHTV